MFPPGVFSSMFIASFFALVLQCGTVVAAMGIVVSTPTVGLKCRALGYAIYGGISILIWFLTIISTISARIAETRNRPAAIAVKAPTFFIAIGLRWVSLILAIVNAAGIIGLCGLQFSNYLETCYCDSSVIGRGAGTYIIINPEGSILQIWVSRVVAIGIAGLVMTFFMVSLWFMAKLPKDIVKSTTQVSGD